MLVKQKYPNENLILSERKITLKSMVEFFSTNKLTSANFKEIYRPYINGVQKGLSNVLIGYKFINNNDDNDL